MVDLWLTVSAWFSTNPLAKLLLILMAFDFASGVLRAARDKQLNSSIATDGLLRKLGILLGLGLADVLETYTRMPDLSEWAAGAFSVTEGLSVVENLGRLGVQVPSFVRDALTKLSPKDPQP